MRTFPRLSRCLGTPCLTLLLGAALIRGKVQARASEALQPVSTQTQSKPVLADEHQKLWSQVLKNTRVETGPRLKNPAISSDGLTPDVVSALREERNYLEAHGSVSLTRASVNAATRELVEDGSQKARSLSPYPCREPMIRSVNGRTRSVVFTPAAANNTYRIEGCFFGDAPGTVQLETRSGLHQSNASPIIAMQLDSTSPGAWSDHEINVRVDPELVGILDYPVTLVIHPPKRRRIELRGSRFVAARGKPQLLSVIPSAWVRLYPSGVGSRSIRQLEYVSPTEPGRAVPRDTTASSAFVVRSDPEHFGIGRDNYDFTQLNPGWVVESVQLQTYSVSCPEVVTPVQSSGGWEAAWTALGMSIAFQETVCTSTAPASFAFSMSMSQYAIRVWVVGPVGTQPLALVP
jgi:hypothetical protein